MGAQEGDDELRFDVYIRLRRLRVVVVRQVGLRAAEIVARQQALVRGERAYIRNRATNAVVVILPPPAAP